MDRDLLLAKELCAALLDEIQRERITQEALQRAGSPTARVRFRPLSIGRRLRLAALATVRRHGAVSG